MPSIRQRFHLSPCSDFRSHFSVRLSTGPGPLFAIMSRERAKLSYRWQAAYIEQWTTSRGGLIRDEETGEPFRVPCCPICASQIVDKDGVPLTAEEMGRKRRTCAGCGSALWQADPKGPKRYPLADYIKKRMKGFFELLIGRSEVSIPLLVALWDEVTMMRLHQ